MKLENIKKYVKKAAARFERVNGIFGAGDGRYFITNGFSLILFNEKPQGVDDLIKDDHVLDVRGYTRLIDGVEYEITLPREFVRSLPQYRKFCKAKGVSGVFPADGQAYNSALLSEVLDFIPKRGIRFFSKDSILIIKNSGVAAMILPVRIKDDEGHTGVKMLYTEFIKTLEARPVCT